VADIRIMWEVQRYTYNGKWIEPLRVVAETASFVTVRHIDRHSGKPYERRKRKDGDVYPTFAEAKAELVRRKELEMRQHQEEVHELNSLLGSLRKLEEPAP
jgi:hypothetical protein